jgi:hypothetical protein
MNNLIRIVSLRSKTKRKEKNKIRGNNGQPAKHNGLEDKKADKKNLFFNILLFFIKKIPHCQSSGSATDLKYRGKSDSHFQMHKQKMPRFPLDFMH